VSMFNAAATAGGAPFGIATGPDGNVWFAETGANRIGRITPSGVVTEFGTGIGPGTFPFGITTGPDGHLWFTGLGDRIGRLNVES